MRIRIPFRMNMRRRMGRSLTAAAVLLISSVVCFAQTGGAQAGAKPLPPEPTVKTPETAPSNRPEPWTKIPVPPLPAFHPEQPTRIELSNGMIVFLQVDHELPLISLTARIRGGSRSESANKVGLVDLYGDVWRTGGTKTKTGDELDDYLEARAAKVETDGTSDSTSIGLNCLKDDFNDVFAVFMDVLLNPEFRADKIDLAKRQAYAGIARRNDDISSIAHRESLVLGYGKASPLARYAEYSTVAAVSREDLLAWHKNYVHPNNMIVGVTGDFDPKQMEAKLRQAFEPLPRGSQAEEPNLAITPAKPGIYYVAKEDVNQSDIRLVGLGIERRNPDYFAVTVMNEVLGGGFSSRLFKSIRTRQGLAYSVGGGVGTAWDHQGLDVFDAGTKSATTGETVTSLKKEIADMIAAPATEVEIKRAKDSILNGFVFNYDTPEKVLRERMSYEFYGYPADFLERFRAGIEKVTPADVESVAKKYLHPGNMPVLVVGNPGEVEPQLVSLGPVTKLDIAIPPPPGETGAGATTGSMAPQR
jgi:zinc protease